MFLGFPLSPWVSFLPSMSYLTHSFLSEQEIADDKVFRIESLQKLVFIHLFT